MTNLKMEKYEDLTQRAINYCKRTNKEFEQAKKFIEERCIISAQHEEVWAYYRWGQAEGIYQALETIGYKSKAMQELAELLNRPT